MCRFSAVARSRESVEVSRLRMKVVWEDGGFELGLVVEDDGAFDDVFEFADVAFPGVVFECFDEAFSECGYRLVGFLRELFYEVVGEQADVVFAFAECG